MFCQGSVLFDRFSPVLPHFCPKKNVFFLFFFLCACTVRPSLVIIHPRLRIVHFCSSTQYDKARPYDSYGRMPYKVPMLSVLTGLYTGPITWEATPPPTGSFSSSMTASTSTRSGRTTQHGGMTTPPTPSSRTTTSWTRSVHLNLTDILTAMTIVTIDHSSPPNA